MSAILLIAAMEIEVKPILRRFRKISGNHPAIYEGRIKNREARVLISGVGEEHASRAAQIAVEMKPKAVIHLGFAGGLNPSLEAGKIFLPFQIRTRNGKSCSLPSFPYPFSPEVAHGVLLTASTVIQTAEEKEKLSALADAVDMESFAVASILAKEKIPFLCIRAILDPARESLPLDFSSSLKNGSVSCQEIGKELLKNPGGIFHLIRLAFRARSAAKRLCRYLDLVLSTLKTSV